jgi:hypothetical protein
MTKHRVKPFYVYRIYRISRGSDQVTRFLIIGASLKGGQKDESEYHRQRSRRHGCASTTRGTVMELMIPESEEIPESRFIYQTVNARGIDASCYIQKTSTVDIHRYTSKTSICAKMQFLYFTSFTLLQIYTVQIIITRCNT